MERIIPEELKEIWIDYVAANELMDTYVKRPFGFKKALKASGLAQRKRHKFWNGIYKLYPDISKKASIDKSTWTIKDETV